MGQRFIPDSYIFQQLVYGQKDLRYLGDRRPFTMETVPNVGPVRAFPRGLDVCAVLGSHRAQDILEKLGDTEYEEYHEQINQLKTEFSSLTEKKWHQNLYWSWLHSWIPLLKERKGENVPEFMETPAWADKQIMTVLGSWTELRHDTILYAKQSYTGMGRAPAPKPVFTHGFVEPCPQVYSRIKDMMFKINEINDEMNLDIPAVQDKIHNFEKALLTLISVSKKELEGRPLTEQEYGFIWDIGNVLKELKSFPEPLQSQITSGTDERMDLIADVHTDLNTSQVLEEGVGSPFHIYVIIQDQKGRRLAHGAVFSYYEFKHPLKDRLTDEKWHEMGTNNQRPSLPLWTHSFIAVQ
jgi:hypothetical protein